MNGYKTNMGALRSLDVIPIRIGIGEITKGLLVKALCQYPVALLLDNQEVQLVTQYAKGAIYLGQIVHNGMDYYENIWLIIADSQEHSK